MAINVFYPRRNFTAIGSYNVSDNALQSEMALLWDDQGPKTINGGLNWRRDADNANKTQLLFELKHPSFEKVSMELLV